MFRSIFNFILFTSVFIALCALLMIWQTNELLALQYPQRTFYLFVFFSTICSYNFHWYLTPGSYSSSERLQWVDRYRDLMLILCGVGLAGALFYFWPLRSHWLVLSGGAILTFLYSAPKVPYKPFTWLRKIAVGKTLFLTGVWTYVTTLLPAFVANQGLSWPLVLFTLHRFLLVYAICILFDYRDIESDKREGIRSLITYLDYKSLNRLYYITLLFSALAAGLLQPYTTIPVIITLLVPVVITGMLTRKAQHNPSDYLFYFSLDGLMALSALLHLILVYIFP
ncbi:UbiA family prenyltransferase [Chitinophaga qingshengii]|uniref:UbiA family prenyltransferase n=1 Tax=Chitinophaga qingshengii TaxID=1569794 RepID=A0ABR7THU6_9BACT|nr:UbiA family prenyltransferase [Chitinophaga qingshengii]MBC9930083.1 UbiA family prenyltransferase [Chitinophaga qingshengii]